MQISDQTAGLITSITALCSCSCLILMSIRIYESKSWPTAKGTIRESRIEENTGSIRRGHFGLIVLYTYIVKGHEYKSDRLYFYDYQSKPWRHYVEKDLLLYPVGKIVTVYYNPRKPYDAVLDRNVPIWMTIFWLFFTSFLLVCGVGFFLKSIK
jgi:hypothetical protein